MIETAEKLADRINSLLPNIKSGTLRFFGVWFGRPYDNVHRIVKAGFDHDILNIDFNDGEVLQVSNPLSCHFSSNDFEIRNAKKVIWKWHYYGKPKIDKYLYSYNFEVSENMVKLITNVTWFTEKQIPDIKEPAVKIY